MEGIITALERGTSSTGAQFLRVQIDHKAWYSLWQTRYSGEPNPEWVWADDLRPGDRIGFIANGSNISRIANHIRGTGTVPSPRDGIREGNCNNAVAIVMAAVIRARLVQSVDEIIEVWGQLFQANRRMMGLQDGGDHEG